MKKKLIYLLCFILLIGLFIQGNRIYHLKLKFHVDRFYSEGVFEKKCKNCHQQISKSTSDFKWLFGNSYTEIFNSINDGHTELGMPGYDTILSDRAIQRIARYLVTLNEMEHEERFLKPKLTKKDTTFFSSLVRLDTVVASADIMIPWGISFTSQNDLFITDRSGRLFCYSDQLGLQNITGVPEVSQGDHGGLLDVIVHPNYETNKIIYLSYTQANNGKSTVFVLKANVNKNVLENASVIFEAQPYMTSTSNYGSRFCFKDNQLYFSIGDRGAPHKMLHQLDNDLGKIHRLNEDGSIPEDNPFKDEGNASESIYSFGHRNPQGLTLNRGTGEIWSSEHGPRGGDEINLIRSSADYGWPQVTHGTNYDGTKITDASKLEGLVDPYYYWVPSMAPSGMAFADSSLYPFWASCVLVASLKYKYVSLLNMSNLTNLQETVLFKGLGRIRAITTDNQGYLYLSVQGVEAHGDRKMQPGCILRLTPLIDAD